MRKRYLIAVLAMVLTAIASPAPALAVDTLSPALVEETMQPGDSVNVEKTLHLDALPGFADIIVAVDTTGSMGGAIAQAKAQATQLCNDVKAAIPGARFAVVDFEDYPLMPFGGAGDTAYLLLTTGYVADCATFSAAINTMAADGGGDLPEAYNRVFFEAVNDPTLLASRNPQAQRFAVVLGDAVPHDATQTQAPACGNAPPTDFGRNNVAGPAGPLNDDIETEAAIAGLVTDGTTLLMINYGGVLACYNQLVAPTGGTAVNSGGDLSDEIIAQIEEAASHIDEAHLEVVGFCALDITFSPTSYTSVTAPADLVFTETITVPPGTLMGKYECTVQGFADGTPRGNPEVVDVIVTAGPPATLTLDPKAAVNPVDSEHCVTATVRDALGQPVSGVTVRFSVTGSVNTSGSATTDANGEAEFCYTGPALPGADVITAYADTDNDEVQDPGEPFDTATKEWILPVTTPGCEIRITNGGWIIANNGDRSSFGGNASADAEGNVSGQEEYQDHGPAQQFNLHGNVLAVVCGGDGKSASIFGQATVDGTGAHNYRINVFDDGEPGTTDRYHMIVDTGYDSGDQVLMGGNVQVRRTD